MFEADVRNTGDQGQDPNERAWDIAQGAETSDELILAALPERCDRGHLDCAGRGGRCQTEAFDPREDWTGVTLDDGTPVFDCPECGQLAVTSEEECPSLSVPRGVGHRPKGRSVSTSTGDGGTR